MPEFRNRCQALYLRSYLDKQMGAAAEVAVMKLVDVAAYSFSSETDLPKLKHDRDFGQPRRG